MTRTREPETMSLLVRICIGAGIGVTLVTALVAIGLGPGVTAGIIVIFAGTLYLLKTLFDTQEQLYSERPRPASAAPERSTVPIGSHPVHTILSIEGRENPAMARERIRVERERNLRQRAANIVTVASRKGPVDADIEVEYVDESGDRHQNKRLKVQEIDSHGDAGAMTLSGFDPQTADTAIVSTRGIMRMSDVAAGATVERNDVPRYFAALYDRTPKGMMERDIDRLSDEINILTYVMRQSGKTSSAMIETIKDHCREVVRISDEQMFDKLVRRDAIDRIPFEQCCERLRRQRARHAAIERTLKRMTGRSRSRKLKDAANMTLKAIMPKGT